MLRRSILAFCSLLAGLVHRRRAEASEDLSSGQCTTSPLHLRSGTNSGRYGRENSVVSLTLRNLLNRSVAVYVADPADEDASHLAPAAQAIFSELDTVNATVVFGEFLQFRDVGTGSLVCELPVVEQYVSPSASEPILLADNVSFCNLHTQYDEPCAAHRCVVTPKTFSINDYYGDEIPGFRERLKQYGWKELPLLPDAKVQGVSRRVQFGVLEQFSPLWHAEKDCCGNKIAMSSGSVLAPFLNKKMLPFTVAANAEQAGKPVPSYLIRTFVMLRRNHRAALFREACEEDDESEPKKWIMKPHRGENSAGVGVQTMFNREIWELLSAGPEEFEYFCSKPWPSHFVHDPVSDRRRSDMLVQDFVNDFMPWPGSRSESGRRWQLRAFILLTELHPPTLHFIDAVAFKGGAPSNSSDVQASYATNIGATKRQGMVHKRDYIYPLEEVQELYNTLDPEAHVLPTWVSDVMPKYVCDIASDLMAAAMANVAPAIIGRNRYNFFALDFLVAENMSLKLMEGQQSPNMNFHALEPCEGRTARTCDVYANISHAIVDVLLRHYDLEPKAFASPSPRVHSCPVQTQIVSVRERQRRLGDSYDILTRRRDT